jgi:gamma-glutamyltranspeptidase/glutathione hydrolase
MDDFSIAPGVANAFGLIGSAANSIQPGKRPLSSMSPTIVLDADANPIFSCGAAGGPKILTTVLQLIVGRLDLNMSLDECVRAPRVHHQWQPDRAVVESSLSDEVIDKLAAKGHTIEKTPRASVAQAIAIDNQLLSAMADPRVPSSAMGVE